MNKWKKQQTLRLITLSRIVPYLQASSRIIIANRIKATPRLSERWANKQGNSNSAEELPYSQRARTTRCTHASYGGTRSCTRFFLSNCWMQPRHMEIEVQESTEHNAKDVEWCSNNKKLTFTKKDLVNLKMCVPNKSINMKAMIWEIRYYLNVG